MISRRTKDGLAAAKAKGVKLGNIALARANRAAALGRAAKLQPIFAETARISARKAADMLNARNVPTPTGRPWSAKTILRVRGRVATLVRDIGASAGTEEQLLNS
jgi:DNA invertase Pin-like site-specific DNA recombinase